MIRPTRPAVWTRLLAISGAVFLLAACGGSAGDETSNPATTVGISTALGTSTTSVAPTTSEPAPSTTAVPEQEPLPTISPLEVPALVNRWGAGDGDPLDLARQIIGFPADIGVPEGSAPLSMSVQLSAPDPAQPRSWDWSYEALSPVAAIDPDLPEGGPGSTLTQSFYGPVLESLGWYDAIHVISSPGSGMDGPRSVNFAYKPGFDTMSVGGVEAEPVVARVWADEDIDYMPGPDRPGYRVDLNVDIGSDAIPVPIPALLFDRLPVVPGAVLKDMTFRSSRQIADSYSPDVYDFAEGDPYLELEFLMGLPSGSTEVAREAYSTGLDGSLYQMGKPSSMALGTVQVVMATVYEGTWTQPVVVFDRYPGTVTVVTASDTGEITVRVNIRFEPDRVELAQP